jgi:hypothetical protein
MEFELQKLELGSDQKKPSTPQILNVEIYKILYSQSTINNCYSDKRTAVEIWINFFPYAAPIQVLSFDNQNSYVSFDNRRLYSAKNYSGNPSIDCIVYNFDSPVTAEIQDHENDVFTLIWTSGNILYRLKLTARTMEGVWIIRCASQDSSFPLNGTINNPTLGPRSYNISVIKIDPAPAKLIFHELDVANYNTSLHSTTDLFIQPVSTVNLFHKRNDMKQLIFNRPELFAVDKYEQCEVFKLKARGEKALNVWDNWDDLFALASERESNIEDLYFKEFYENLEVFCRVFQYKLQSDSCAISDGDVKEIEK